MPTELSERVYQNSYHDAVRRFAAEGDSRPTVVRLCLNGGGRTRLVGAKAASALPRFDVSQLQRAGMVSETVLSTLGGVIVGSLLTGGFNYLNTQQQVQSANQRQRAEFVAERKVDELIELANELYRARGLIIHSRFMMENDDEIPIEELAEMSIKLQRKGSTAGMFLDNEKIEPINDYIHELINAQLKILDDAGRLDMVNDMFSGGMVLEDKDIETRAAEFDFDELNDAYGEAISVLRWEVAEPIERLR